MVIRNELKIKLIRLNGIKAKFARECLFTKEIRLLNDKLWSFRELIKNPAKNIHRIIL